MAETDDPQTGVVIVALPRADDPCQAIGPEQKHATLLYFGDVPGGDNANDRLDDSARALMVQILKAAAAAYGPLTEQVTKVDQLGDAGAHVWMLKGTELPDLRSDLLDTDSELVGMLEAVEQFPTYTPHVTVGYDQPAPDQQTLVAGAESETVTDDDLAAAALVSEITFDRLALWWAGDQLEYPLTGTADPGRGSVTEARRPGGPMPQLHESTRLVEVGKAGAAGEGTGTRLPIQIITPGWGSSGYYSADVLERAARNRVIPKGTHMYLNHASESEARDRPEREVEKIAAVLVEDAQWDGQRLFAEADIMTPHAELIDALKPYIGVSISGSATDITMGEAEGRRGPIIEDLAHVDSVDFVTHAGRGGMVLLESARPSIVNALAVEHGIAEATANDTREQLQQVLRDTYGGEKSWVWVRDFDDTTVWYEHETPDSCATYALTYETTAEGVVSLTGDPTEVRARTEYVPATRPDSTTTTKESEEVPMGQIQIDEAEHQRLVEAAGRVDTLSTERDTEKARADAAEAQLAEAKKTARPRTPREVMEARDSELRNQVATLAARERARDIIAEELTEAWLPATTVARLSSELLESLPLAGEDMQLDEQGLRGRCVEVRDQHELEAAEALQAAGVGTPRGLGSLRPAARVDEAATEGALKTAFQSFGLSESAADTAAKGR
jgi:hypothetical protein